MINANYFCKYHDIGAGMATGKAWFKVPSAIKFNLHGKMKEFITGKDLILHIIGMIGVDGALYKTMEFHPLQWMIALQSRTWL